MSTKRMSALNLTAGIACIAMLSGCGRSTDLTSSLGASLDNAASSAADAALGAMQSDLQAADSLTHGPCAAPGFPLGIPTGCSYDAGSESFACSLDVGRDGLTRTRSYQFLDGSGAAQSAYDALTTASIRFVSTVAGTANREGRTLTIEDRRELIESGLEGSETLRVWNGTGNSSRVESGTTAVNHQSATVVDQVVIPAPWARDSWPVSGTVTTHRTSSTGLDETSVITFNGTRYATLTIGDRTVSIDLARGGRGGGRGRDGGPGHPGGRGRGPGRR